MSSENRPQQAGLEEEFDEAIIKDLRGINYVPVAEVVSRLNKVLGVNNWSTHITSIGRDEHNPEYVIAHVGITAKIDGELCSADGIGGQKVKTFSGSDDLLDLGRDFKGAYSDALKKAAQRLGVALHLARDEEAMDLDVEPDVPNAEWEKTNNKVKNMTPVEIEVMKKWWAKNGNSTKPQQATIGDVLFDAYSELVDNIAGGDLGKNPVTAEGVAEAFGGQVTEEGLIETDEAPF